ACSRFPFFGGSHSTRSPEDAIALPPRPWQNTDYHLQLAGMSVAIVTSPEYLKHDLADHPENAQRLRAIEMALDSPALGLRDFLVPLSPQPASLEQLNAAHHAGYIQGLRQAM